MQNVANRQMSDWRRSSDDSVECAVAAVLEDGDGDGADGDEGVGDWNGNENGNESEDVTHRRTEWAVVGAVPVNPDRDDADDSQSVPPST